MSGHLDIIKWMTAASIVTGVPSISSIESGYTTPGGA